MRSNMRPPPGISKGGEACSAGCDCEVAEAAGGAGGVCAIAVAATAPTPSPPVTNKTRGSGDFIGRYSIGIDPYALNKAPSIAFFQIKLWSFSVWHQ
jgi:hypothetical protein